MTTMDASNEYTMTTPRIRGALQKVNINNFDSWENNKSNNHNNNNNNNSTNSSDVKVGKSKESTTTKTKSNDDTTTTTNKNYQYFYNQVIDKLQHSHPCNIEKAKQSSKDKDEQAIEIITNLIQFEQRYGKIYGTSSSSSSTSTTTTTYANNHDSIIQSPPQSNNILNDLFKADASTLRHYAMHFVYLFSVNQKDIMEKMNDLYVFHHQASSMIDKLKSILGFDSNCSLEKVLNKVVDIMKGENAVALVDSNNDDGFDGNGGKKTILSSFEEQGKKHDRIPNQHEHGDNQNHHQQRVRFNVVVEEFS